MTNTSATGGYLAPINTPNDDSAFDAIIQELVVGITGLPGQLVRPRWQPVQPDFPPVTTNWCAIGITSINADIASYIEHISDGIGEDHVQRHETVEILTSFYGLNSLSYANRFKDGLTVGQNRERLLSLDIGILECSQVRNVPEFVNQQWLKRCDLVLKIRRQVNRVYSVLHSLSATLLIHKDNEPLSPKVPLVINV